MVLLRADPARGKGGEARSRYVMLRCRISILLLCWVGAGGCGGDNLVKVTGTVLRNGKPVPNLGLHFVPENGLSSHGRTDADGHFELLYTTGKEGAVVGAHKVWVQLPPDPQQRGDVHRRASEPDMDALLQKYGNSETTPLTVEIKGGQEEIILRLD
jgi:hypothetical protein